MTHSHAAGWGSDAPTPAQVREFFAQIESGRITQRRLQPFLVNRPEPHNIHLSGAYEVTVRRGPDAIKKYLEKGFPKQQPHFQVSDETFPQGPEFGSAKVPVHFVYFGRHIGNAEALREFDRLDYKAVGPSVLLAFARHYPDVVWAYRRIAALGQFYQGRFGGTSPVEDLAVCLQVDGKFLEAWAFSESIWKSHDTEVRFAVVPKEYHY